jgi:DNA-binding XRE family transcriptional regulator
VIVTAKPKETQSYDYRCKCGASSVRSLGSWRIQCKCGKYQECRKQPWKKPIESIGEQLKAYREKQRWSQELLAEVIGISQALLSGIESGEKPVSADVAALIKTKIKTIVV